MADSWLLHLSCLVLQGHGHTVNYLDRSKVTKYVALEPNTLMHAFIRAKASEAGYDESAGSFQLLECGAEDVTAILTATAGQQVDTIISVLTLCSVPSPNRTIRDLVQEVLKPGGNFLFYEHVLSDRKDVAWWQHFWTPIWSAAFDGCRLDRPTHKWIEEQGACWREGQAKICEGEEENLFGHRFGKFVKA
jgi:SAM-dependent methyltransferase